MLPPATNHQKLRRTELREKCCQNLKNSHYPADATGPMARTSKSIRAGRALFQIRAAVMWPLRAALEWWDLYTMPAVKMFGIDVHCPNQHVGLPMHRAMALTNIRNALSLIGKFEPHCLRHIPFGAIRILVGVASSSGYLPRTRTILLQRELILEHDVETIASAIVQQTTHARIRRWGIRTWSDLIRRIEQRCLREQVAFLKRVPGTEDLVRHYSSLENDQWWSPERKRQRRVEYYGS